MTGPNARRFRVSFRGRPEVLSMKIDSDADTRTGLYTERGCGPRGWGCCIFSVSHPPYPGGPRPPPCIALVQESTFPPVFLKRKTGRPSGVLRGIPPCNPRYFDFQGHCGTPQWRVTINPYPQYTGNGGGGLIKIAEIRPDAIERPLTRWCGTPPLSPHLLRVRPAGPPAGRRGRSALSSP